MSMDQTGVALATLIIKQLPKIPVSPISTGPTIAQPFNTPGVTVNQVVVSAQYPDGYQRIPDGYYSSQAEAAQLALWTSISKEIIQYFVSNVQLIIPSIPVPASGLKDSLGFACTGTANTTAENGVGSIK